MKNHSFVKVELFEVPHSKHHYAGGTLNAHMVGEKGGGEKGGGEKGGGEKGSGEK